MTTLPNAKNTKGKRTGKRGTLQNQAKKTGKDGQVHANSCGAKRGARGGQHDTIFVKEQPRIQPDAPDEGLHVLVQTGTCRRLVLTEIYGNRIPRNLLSCTKNSALK